MILVTGATGLVGMHLVQLLASQGKPVKATYHSSAPKEMQGVEWVHLDILDVTQVDEVLQDVQQVYHCAATVSFNPKEKNLLFKNNIEGTANIVNGCLNNGVDKLLFVSSVAALGRIRQGQTVNETMNWSEETSNSLYGKTKFLAEMEVWRGIGEGLKAVIINPTIILGNSNWLNGSTAIFRTAYDEFPWYTNGSSGFVDVVDVAKAMVLLMESEITAQRFILSGWNLPYKQVFSSIANAFNKRQPHKMVTPFLASIVWRIEAIKSFFTKKKPLLTKETAATAQASVQFNNGKLLQQFPNFKYNNFDDSIKRICEELKKRYSLA